MKNENSGGDSFPPGELSKKKTIIATCILVEIVG
jgi:hypothetical protein